MKSIQRESHPQADLTDLGLTAPHRTAPTTPRRREVEERIDHFAAGLEQERLTPPNPDGMKLLALYSRNRPEWLIAEQVCVYVLCRDLEPGWIRSARCVVWFCALCCRTWRVTSAT